MEWHQFVQLFMTTVEHFRVRLRPVHLRQRWHQGKFPERFSGRLMEKAVVRGQPVSSLCPVQGLPSYRARQIDATSSTALAHAVGADRSDPS